MNPTLELALEAVLLFLIPLGPATLLYRALPSKSISVKGVWKFIRVQVTGASALYIVLLALSYYFLFRPYEARKSGQALTEAQDLVRRQSGQIDALNKEVSELRGKESSTALLSQTIQQLTMEKTNLSIDKDKAVAALEALRVVHAAVEDQIKTANSNLSKRRQLWRVTGQVQVMDKHGSSAPINTSKLLIYPDRPPDVRHNGAFVLWVYKTYNEAGGEEFPVLKFTYGDLFPANLALNGTNIGENYEPEFHEKDDPPSITLRKPIVLRPLDDTKRLGSK